MTGDAAKFRQVSILFLAKVVDLQLVPANFGQNKKVKYMLKQMLHLFYRWFCKRQLFLNVDVFISTQ